METRKEQTPIRVVVRKRPVSSKERAKNDADIMEKRGTQVVAVKEIR